MLKSLIKSITNQAEGPAIETETSKEIILDSAIKRSKITIHNGKVTLRQWDRQEVKAYVSIRATGAYAEQAGEEKNTDQFWALEVRGSTLVFEQLHPRRFIQTGSLNIDLEIFVPQQSDGDVTTHNGVIEISDYQGDLDAQTHNGNLSLEKITGTVNVSTHNGHIDIEGLQGNLRMNTHNGHLHATGVTGRVKAQTHNGKISLDNAGSNGVCLHTHSGAIRVKTSQAIIGEWEMTTHSGDIDLHLPSATNAMLVLKTSSGRIGGTALSTELTRDTKKVIAQLGEGKLPIHIETHRGDIEVQYND